MGETNVDSPRGTQYRITVRGRLDPIWEDNLSGMTITLVNEGPPATTELSGELIDQSALHGVLNALHELHLPILSTEMVRHSEVEPIDSHDSIRGELE